MKYIEEDSASVESKTSLINTIYWGPTQWRHLVIVLAKLHAELRIEVG